MAELLAATLSNRPQCQYYSEVLAISVIYMKGIIQCTLCTLPRLPPRQIRVTAEQMTEGCD